MANVQSFLLPGAAQPATTGPVILAPTNAFPGISFPQHFGFNPTSLITGNGGFWRADMGVTQSGGIVSSVADQSSFATALAPSAAAPSWSSSTWQGPGITGSFPGLDLSFGGGLSLVSSSGATVFPSTVTVSLFILLLVISAGSSARILSIVEGSQDFNSPAMTLYDGNGHPALGVFSNSELGNGGSSVNFTTDTAVLLGTVLDGTNANKWLNGVVQGTGTAFTASIGGQTTTAIDLGTTGSGGNESMLVAFFGVTQKAMNSTDWTNLKNWANTNWGTSF